MNRRWLWLALALIPMVVGMAVVSVLAVSPDRSVARYPIQLDSDGPVTIHRLPADMDVPASDRWRPSAVVITNDGEQIRAFSNRSYPFGCAVVVRVDKTLTEPCHGAVWDLAGALIAGPQRYVYAYPVRVVSEGRVEVDLARPALVVPTR